MKFKITLMILLPILTILTLTACGHFNYGQEYTKEGTVTATRITDFSTTIYFSDGTELYALNELQLKIGAKYIFTYVKWSIDPNTSRVKIISAHIEQ